MRGEDFAYMLEARPGAFIFCGNGDSAGCIIRPTISTTTPLSMAPRTGSSWWRTRWRVMAPHGEEALMRRLEP